MEKADNHSNWIWPVQEDMNWFDEEDVYAIAELTTKVKRRRL